MTLHIIKLCVGISSVEELERWQKELTTRHARKNLKTPFRVDHVTRQTPQKSADVLDGGSLYWVINGQIACRRKILGFEQTIKNNIPHCRILMDHDVIRVMPRPFRAFQGWRYLKPADAPLDLGLAANEDHFLQDLKQIGVI